MPGLLDQYRLLLEAAERMLAAARDDRWADVRRIEDHCGQAIATLRDARRRETLSPADDRERMAVMLDIVRIDAEVRRLAQPWIHDLDRMLAPRPTPGT